MTRSGFTLIELLVVLAIIATLLTLAVPRYYASIDKSKEAVLKENLYQMRDAIGKYYADRGKYPESLQALATDKYLRSVPLDPVTESATTWVVVRSRRSAEGRRVRREERRAGQGARRQRILNVVTRRGGRP